MSQQWVQTGSTPMEGVEKTNAVMVHPNQRVGLVQCNPYTMEVDRGNRNCYNCRGFGHLARNCRNRGTGNIIGEERRLEYGQRLVIERNNRQCNLNREGDLVVLD